MIGNRVALDTNIVIDYLDEQPDSVTVVDRLSNIFIPATVVGELYVGIYRSLPQIKQSKQAKIERFIGASFVLNVDAQVAETYAFVKASLLKRGRPIPENDIWIAALSLQHNLPLYTYDKHFREVDGLQLFNPLSPV